MSSQSSVDDTTPLIVANVTIATAWSESATDSYGIYTGTDTLARISNSIVLCRYGVNAYGIVEPTSATTGLFDNDPDSLHTNLIVDCAGVPRTVPYSIGAFELDP